MSTVSYRDRITKRILYSDLDMRFNVHPLKGDIIPVKESEAVMNALKNLMLTHPGERPFNPTFGVPFYTLLFDLASLNPLDLETQVISAINKHEKRVLVKKVNYDIYHDYNAIELNIIFSIINQYKEYDLQVLIKRTK